MHILVRKLPNCSRQFYTNCPIKSHPPYHAQALNYKYTVDFCKILNMTIPRTNN